MKIAYRGERAGEDSPFPGMTNVTFRIDDERPELLPRRLDLRNHSPTGFEWGYAGSGPAQLALALCAHALDDDDDAERVYQKFKFDVVARWPRQQGWTITADEIRAWRKTIKRLPV